MGKYYVVYRTAQNNSSELYHYGVPGMKWGRRRAERRYERKLSRYGRQLGMAEYERDKGLAAYKRHDEKAAAIDKMANEYTKQGKHMKAYAAQKSAEALRARGANQKAKRDAEAIKYELKAEKLNKKVTKFATKKKINAGQDRINDILGKAKSKGYNQAAAAESDRKERALYDTLGSTGYNVYDKTRSFVTGR